MSTHGWEDDDNYVGYGILRDSAEGRKITEEVSLRYMRRMADEKELRENPHRRLAKIAEDLQTKQRRKRELEAELARLNPEIANLQQQLMQTGEEVKQSIDKQQASLTATLMETSS